MGYRYGLTASNEQAEEAHKVIRTQLHSKYGEDSDKVQILYGIRNLQISEDFWNKKISMVTRVEHH